MQTELQAARFSNEVFDGMVQDPDGTLELLQGLPGAEQQLDHGVVALAAWERLVEPLQQGVRESPWELRKRLLAWAIQQHPQAGWILQTCFDRYPKAIGIHELGDLLEVQPLQTAYQNFHERLHRFYSLGLLEPVGQDGIPSVRAVDAVFSLTAGRPT